MLIFLKGRGGMARIFIVSAALLWGALAIFVKKLTNYRFSEMEIVAIRVFGAFLCLVPIMLMKQKKSVFCIKINHLLYFLGTGLCSIVLFNWAYFKAMNMMSISLAVMLLYTAPAFVVLLSAIFLKEKLTMHKVIAVIVTISGCAIIASTEKIIDTNWTLLGFLIGLCSGIGYALYTIFGKLALRHYDSLTITFYTFFIASIAMIPFFSFIPKAVTLPLEAWIYMFGLGLVPTVFAYFLYTTGLKKIESSLASILATVEPVAAVMIGIFIFKEQLYSGQLIGALLIVISIIIISYDQKVTGEQLKNEVVS